MDLAARDLTWKGHKDLAAYASSRLHQSDGQAVTFILRTSPKEDVLKNKVAEIDAVKRRLIAPLGAGSWVALHDPFLTKVTPTCSASFSLVKISPVVFAGIDTLVTDCKLFCEE
jgi:hypothetical protein